MNERGITPSLDRIAYRRRALILAAAAVAMMLVALVAISGVDGVSLTPRQLRETLAVGPEQPAVEELGAAIEAARGFALDRFREERIDGVAWANTRHEGHLGWYRIEEEFLVTDASGQTHGFTYTIAVNLSPEGEWTLQSIAVDPTQVSSEDFEPLAY
jgi:hypothetical protein